MGVRRSAPDFDGPGLCYEDLVFDKDGAKADPARSPMDYVGETRAFTTNKSRGADQTFHADGGCRHLIDADRLSVYPIESCRRAVYMRPCPDCTTEGSA